MTVATPCCVVDFIDDSIVACSDSPCSLRAFQLLAAGRSGVIRQGFQLLFDHLKGGGGNRFQFSSCSAGNDYVVAHLRLRRISVSACSKGMEFPLKPLSFHTLGLLASPRFPQGVLRIPRCSTPRRPSRRVCLRRIGVLLPWMQLPAHSTPSLRAEQ